MGQLLRLWNIYDILSDPDSMRMLQMISDGHKLRICDFSTPRRYHTRIRALKDAQLVSIRIKKDNGKKQAKKEYALTDMGWTIHQSLPKLRYALSLYWKLDAIDALDKEVPLEEYNKLVESLIRDEAVHNILLKR